MGQPALSALAPLPFELVYSDGEPLETEWHTYQYPFLRHLIRQAMVEQGRSDFYVGGDMFVYYSIDQARDVAQGRPYFRGPDVFWVGGVDSLRKRKCWVSWEEGGKLPEVVVELLSPSTAAIDRKEKKELYSRVWRTPEYFLCERETLTLEGFRLSSRFSYQPIVPDAQGRLWSEQLGVFLGFWHGLHEGREYDWARLFRPDGSLVPSTEEQADGERQRADAERQRADAAEMELRHLRSLLQTRNQS